MARAIAAGWALFAAVPVCAQVGAAPEYGDPRLQVMDYRAGEVVPIHGVVGFQLSIELAPDEVVRTIALGDAGAWQASADKAGNRLFLKPLIEGVTTNMTVVTDVRTYAFELTGGDASGTVSPWTIRFRYPASERSIALASPAASGMIGRYRLTGDRNLRPAAISDDGVRTFIDWPAEVVLPATYIRDTGGRETLANGYMRGSFYVLDSVERHLVFRLDRRVARADRQSPDAQ